MIVRLLPAGQEAETLVRYIEGKSKGVRVDLGFGKMTVRKRRRLLYWASHILRADRDRHRGSETRHIVFSCRAGIKRGIAVPALLLVAEDWRREYAPDVPWLEGLHYHEGRWHLHLAVRNSGSNGKPLRLRPHQVIAMSRLAFTTNASGEGGGGGGHGVPVYPKAKKLVVRDLAKSLLSDTGHFFAGHWSRLIKTGVVTDFRKRKNGSAISFIFKGRRMRVATLAEFVAREQRAMGLAQVDDAMLKVLISTPQHQAVKVPHALLKKINSKMHGRTVRMRSQTNKTKVRTPSL